MMFLLCVSLPARPIATMLSFKGGSLPCRGKSGKMRWAYSLYCDEHRRAYIVATNRGEMLCLPQHTHPPRGARAE